MLYVLDTDTFTYIQLGQPSVLNKVRELRPEQMATTIVTMYEQLKGRLAAINQKQKDEDVLLAFQRLQQTQQQFCRVRILPFDQVALTQYHHLVQQKLRIGTQDLRIAAIALSQQAIVVTSNQRHFRQIPGLQIESWR